jgi:hypothetical protein
MRTNPVHSSATLQEASGTLLEFALDPRNWLASGHRRISPAYLRVVGRLEICASVDVTQELRTYFRVSFRAPGLSPMKAADLLEEFVKGRFTFAPNTEWEVEIDARRWIHFARRYTGNTLTA